MKQFGINWVVLLAAFIFGCSKEEISTNLDDYEIKEEARTEGMFFPGRDTDVDSLFLKCRTIQTEKTYSYYSKEEQLHDPNEALYNHVYGYFKYAKFETEKYAKEFFKELSLLEINCVMRVGSQVFAINDGYDLREITENFGQRIRESFPTDTIDEYVSSTLR